MDDQAQPPTGTETVKLDIRARYFETDQMGVVHHAHYLVWFEAARSEFCRRHGIDYAQMERDGLILPVLEARCQYLRPVRYDETVTIHSWVVEISRSLLRVRYAVRSGETLHATGETIQMLTDKSGKPRRFPPDIAARFGGGTIVSPPPHP